MTKPKAKPPATSYTPRFAALTTEVDTTRTTPEYTGYLSVKETRQFDNLNYTLEGVIKVAEQNGELTPKLQQLRWVHEAMPGTAGWVAGGDNKKIIPFSTADNPVMAKGMTDYCTQASRAEDILFLSGVKVSDLRAKPKMRM